MTDEEGSLLESYTYDAFGFQEERKNNSNNHHQYNGEEYDEETGLIFLRNRYYDPEIGRFISSDYTLGSLYDPQTLNPYVFVQNNPINYIDPTGLKGEIVTKLVALTFFVNPAGVRTPDGHVSHFGHGWEGGVKENGEPFTIGRWPKGFETDEYNVSFCKETAYMTLWVTPEQQTAAINAIKQGSWTPWNNCIDHVCDALDAIGYPHPSFAKNSISWPNSFYIWIGEEQTHINPNFVPRPDSICVPYDLNPQCRGCYLSRSFANLFEPDFGGVSLSKSAELMTNISDLSGAVYDEKTGQLILYGKKNLPLPEMKLDDLAVAVRSIYGLGAKQPEDPGVSMEPDKNGKKMIVSYFGVTENTSFGRTMFEADRVLKSLELGIDSCTGKKLKPHVAGYKSLLDRYARSYNTAQYVRMWFVPQKISLKESEDGSSMIFDQVRMQVLTESKFKGKNIQDYDAENFANHFTANYDAFSGDFPILKDLKQLGKITAIVKWIREQGLPFDCSFFKSYAPEVVYTPFETTIRCNAVNNNMLFTMIGGVVYHLDNSNFSTNTDIAASTAKENVLNARPNEEDICWDFNTNGNNYTAVASSLTKSQKVGNVKKSFLDMQFPVLGNFSLSLVRYYNSFNEKSSGFGCGWELSPAKLTFLSAKSWFKFSDNLTLQCYPQVLVTLEEQSTLYKLVGLNADKKPIYKAAGKDATLTEDDCFCLQQNKNVLLFNHSGRLTEIRDKNNNALNYTYNDHNLVKISQGDKAITLEYSKDRITCSKGPGGKIIYYTYTPEGQLQEVQDKEGLLMNYSYDKDLHLCSIVDASGHKIFDASYDVYNRAQEETLNNNACFKQQFNLAERLAKIESNNFSIEEAFDEFYRPQSISDTYGHQLQFTYSNNFGPESVTDNNGLQTTYEYDNLGHPIKIKDAYRGERKFSFDNLGNLLAKTDGKGVTTVYQYNEKNQLIKVYAPFVVAGFCTENGKHLVKGDERYATAFSYDENGNLQSMRRLNKKINFSYDERGLLLETSDNQGSISKRTYDERGRLVCQESSNQKLQFQWDERDHLKTVLSPLGLTHYSYDATGNLLSTLSDSEKSTFEYDACNTLIKTTDTLGNACTYEYDTYGNLIKINFPNGATREFEYDFPAKIAQ